MEMNRTCVVFELLFTFKQVETMIGNLKVAFKALVDEASWMDESTKVVAREKADYMSQFVGYPDFVKNKTAVEEYYSGVRCSYNTLEEGSQT